MPYTPEGDFEWEYPAHVLSAVDGHSFIADIDLGFHMTLRALVVTRGIETLPGEVVRARKEAQRLLQYADVFLRTRGLVGQYSGRYRVLADVHYSPFHVTRSEQASFAAAMLASGYVRGSHGLAADADRHGSRPGGRGEPAERVGGARAGEEEGEG